MSFIQTIQNKAKTYISQKAISWNSGEIIKWLFDGKGGDDITISTAFKRHVWVYSCVNAIARNIARVPFKIYRFDKEQETGELVNLFNYVNPFINRYQLWEGTETFKQIKGEAFWHLIKGVRNNVIEIEILNPDNLKPDFDRDGNLIGWTYLRRNQSIPLDKDDVIHFKFYNPYNPMRGLSPLQAAMLSVETDDLAGRFNRSILKNGSYPGSVLEYDKILSDDQYARRQEEFQQRHKGVDKAGRIAILEGGMKYKEVKLTPSEVVYIEQRKMSKLEIHSCYRVPEAMTGDTEAYNMANMNDIKKNFWTQTLIPELVYIQDVLKTDFFERYYPEYEGKFDLSVISELQTELEQKIDSAYKLWQMGIPLYDLNKKLEIGFDLEKYSWTKTWWVGFNLVPVGESQTSEPAPEPEKNVFLKTLETIKQIESKKENNEYIKYKKWKALINRLMPIEKRYASKLSAFFMDLRREVLGNYYDVAKGFEKNIKKLRAKLLKLNKESELKEWKQEFDKLELFNVSNAKKEIQKLSKPFFEDAIKKGIEAGLFEINMESTFNLVNETTLRTLSKRTIKIDDVIDTVKDSMKTILREGTEQGLTYSDIADNLRQQLNIASNRSNLIARTEINSCGNEGKFDAYKENGIEKKEWLNSYDDRVRDSHQINEIINIDDVFSNGLKYPGDPEGSADEVINCRCSILAVIE